MKKIIISALALLAAIAVNANPVGIQKARKVAGLRLDVQETALREVPTGQSDPAYYIFNRQGGGFAIISADDCLTPVLGYSDRGGIDPDRIPENMKFWLGQVSAAATEIREIGYKPLRSTLEEWECPVRPQTKAGGSRLLELPKWYQEAPYNYYCPRIKGESGQSMTGCVATAISMVMRYHEWPPCGTGTLPDYHMYYEGSNYTGYYYLPGHELGHEYKWSLMPFADVSVTSSSYTPSEGEKQIAWLMYDCGIMMQAGYSYDGTGAISQYIPGRMHEYMHYKRASYVAKDNYQGDWVALLKAQIDRGLPVIYGADDSSQGGHQFLVCGYDESDRLYVNWGWAGSSDGYYAISSFVPKSSGLRFTSNHDAIINLEPDRSFVPVPVEQEEPEVVVPSKSNGPDEPEYDVPSTTYLQADAYSNNEYYGLEVYSGQISAGSTFSMTAGVLKNPTNVRYTGYYRFDQCSYDGTFIGTLGYYKKNGSITTFYVNGGRTYAITSGQSCKASFPISLGDKIILSTSTTNNASSTWTQVPWAKDGYTLGEYPMINMAFIDPVSRNDVVNTAEFFLEYNVSDLGNAVRAEIDYEDGSSEIIILEL